MPWISFYWFIISLFHFFWYWFQIQVDSVAEEVEQQKFANDLVNIAVSCRTLYPYLGSNREMLWVMKIVVFIWMSKTWFFFMDQTLDCCRYLYMEGLVHCIQMWLLQELRKHLQFERCVLFVGVNAFVCRRYNELGC